MTEERAPYSTEAANSFKLKQVVWYLNWELDLETVGSLPNAELKSFERILHHWQQMTEQLVKARLAGQAAPSVQFAEGQGHD
jgi:hypothetical protein